MYSNMKIVILILLLFTGGSVIKAQRHYKRISALEGSYGTNIFGKADNMANISFSKYIYIFRSIPVHFPVAYKA